MRISTTRPICCRPSSSSRAVSRRRSPRSRRPCCPTPTSRTPGSRRASTTRSPGSRGCLPLPRSGLWWPRSSARTSTSGCRECVSRRRRSRRLRPRAGRRSRVWTLRGPESRWRMPSKRRRSTHSGSGSASPPRSWRSVASLVSSAFATRAVRSAARTVRVVSWQRPWSWSRAPPSAWPRQPPSSFRRVAVLGRTDLDVFPLCLGGNVFGWTADERESHAVLDAYADAGGNFIDTANSYLVEHGQSETIIGRWLAQRGNRDEIVVATKVGGGRGPLRNLRPETIASEARASLGRLQTDRIDLYYAHFDDVETPLEDTLRAFDSLVRDGIVRHVAASNYSPDRLTAALELQREHGLAEFTVLQPHYNLVEREFERTLMPVAETWDLAVLPYFALAKGFLTGKYRPGGEDVESARAEGARTYLDTGAAALEALDEIAAAHRTTLAAVALAWLLAQPRVVAPIASARTTEQLEQILPAATLELTSAEVERLTAAAPAP